VSGFNNLYKCGIVYSMFSKSLTLSFLITLMLVSLTLPINTYAASCGSSNEEELDDEYDDSVDDFDDEVTDSDIDDQIRDVRTEIRRQSSRSARSDAIGVALRRLDNSIDSLDDEGDSIYNSFRDLGDRSRFEDCDDEISDKARDLRDYIRDIVRGYRDDVDDLNDDYDDIDDRRRSSRDSVRAPVWNWGDGSSTAEEEEEEEEENDRERSSEEISREISDLFKRIERLIIEFAVAKKREAND